MRYFIIIADGQQLVGDRSLETGQSERSGLGADLFAALADAHTPALDAMGRLGKVGLAATHAAGANSHGRGAFALLGAPAPVVSVVSDALLDAAGSGVPLEPGDAVLRVGFVRVSPDDADGLLIGTESRALTGDRKANGLVSGTNEYAALFDDLAAHWREAGTLTDPFEIVRTSSGGRLLIRRAAHAGDQPSFEGVELIDPATITGEPWIEHLPDGGRKGDAELLCALITESRRFLADHPINAARAEQGLDAINLAWFWDAGTMPASGFNGLNPSEITAFVDGAADPEPCTQRPGLCEGLCALLGVKPTQGIAPDAGADLADAITAAETPIVLVLTRRDAEGIDANIVAPLLARLAGEPIDRVADADDAPWRVLVAVSHDPAGAEGAAEGLTPFVLAGGRVRSIVDRRLSEAIESDLIVDPASDLLEYVLKSGLRGVV